MYINFKYARQKNIVPGVILFFQMCKQNKFEDVSENLYILCGKEESFFTKYEEDGLVEHVKGKKNQTKFHTVRLSKKGLELLEKLETPDITDDDVEMFDYLCKMYLENDPEGKRTIGNKKNTLMYTAQFRNMVGLTVHQMYWLCMLFVKEFQYTQVLELIYFVKSKNPYGKFRDNLADSKLFQFYESRKEDVEAYWKLKIKE